MVFEQGNDVGIEQGSECSSDHKHNLWDQVAWNQILALPLASSVTQASS